MIRSFKKFVFCATAIGVLSIAANATPLDMTHNTDSIESFLAARDSQQYDIGAYYADNDDGEDSTILEKLAVLPIGLG